MMSSKLAPTFHLWNIEEMCVSCIPYILHSSPADFKSVSHHYVCVLKSDDEWVQAKGKQEGDQVSVK